MTQYLSEMKMTKKKTERRDDGRTEGWKDGKMELFTFLITDRVCQDMRNGNLIQVPLRVQVPWWGARKILRRYFHSRASRQGRGVCRNNGGRPWNRLLWRSHTPILLECRLAEAEVEHSSEFRSELQVQA